MGQNKTSSINHKVLTQHKNTNYDSMLQMGNIYQNITMETNRDHHYSKRVQYCSKTWVNFDRIMRDYGKIEML